ncbi:MAG: glycosyltransferase family 4 protein [Desulfovibrionaceae bacterium]
MKICVIAGYAPSLLNFRGPLLRAMVECGHEVAALAPSEDVDGVAQGLAELGVSFRPVRLSRRGMNPLKDYATILDLRAALETEQAELVFSYTIKPVIYGSMAAGRAGLKRIYSLVTGQGRVFQKQGWTGLFLGGLVKGLYRGALQYNNCVFFQNPDDERVFRETRMLAPDARTVVTYGTGVDLDHFAETPLPDGPPVFLCVARLLREKGLAELAEAARLVRREHPEAEFRLLGPFEAGPGGVSRAEVEAWEREGGLRHLGVTGDVRPHLAEASVAVLPSYYGEGLPRSLQEAAAMGRAVVTTDHPGCREAVRDGQNGLLVPVRDAAALSEALKAFILDPEKARRMGRASRVLAEERFDVRKINAALLREMELC